MWNAVIASRVRGQKCPACENRVVYQGLNDLQTLYPGIAKEWDRVRNRNLKPSDVQPASYKSVFWKGFVLSGILVFSDKVIDDEFSKKTKEWIAMTKVGRLFAEEAEQKVAKKVVDMITSIMSKGYTEIEACDLAGISLENYEKAKNLVDSTVVVA